MDGVETLVLVEVNAERVVLLLPIGRLVVPGVLGLLLLLLVTAVDDGGGGFVGGGVVKLLMDKEGTDTKDVKRPNAPPVKEEVLTGGLVREADDDNEDEEVFEDVAGIVVKEEEGVVVCIIDTGTAEDGWGFILVGVAVEIADTSVVMVEAVAVLESIGGGTIVRPVVAVGSVLFVPLGVVVVVVPLFISVGGGLRCTVVIVVLFNNVLLPPLTVDDDADKELFDRCCEGLVDGDAIEDS